MTRQKWSVWSAEVRYSDDPTKSKIRPVVIIDETTVALCLRVTSSSGHRRYELKQWSAANLDHQSYVDCSALVRLDESDFHGYIGDLDVVDVIGITRLLNSGYIQRIPNPILDSIIVYVIGMQLYRNGFDEHR